MFHIAANTVRICRNSIFDGSLLGTCFSFNMHKYVIVTLNWPDVVSSTTNERRREKTALRGFRPGPT